MFASPAGCPARTALLVKEFEKFTPNRSKPESVRRTTQEYLDEVSDHLFVTPPYHNFKRRTLESEIFATPDCYRVVHMETPKKSLLDIIPGTDYSLMEGDGEDSCSIMVAVRVRPYSQRELSDANVKRVVSMNRKETTVTTESGGVHRFAFDFSFWSFDGDHGDFADQGRVYASLAQPLLGKAFEGYNTCLFAYGQTGSGKSYSIMGHGEERGIIPRFCEELFGRVVRLSTKEEVNIGVEISFFEIYNEKIHDLLASSKEKNGKKATLKVREHPVLGPYVEGLSTFVVNSFEDVEGWITLGTKNRATAATGMNDKSSRSHSVFTIVLTQTRTERLEDEAHDHSTTSKINLVDLAGSERQSQAQTTGDRLREGANINKSLLTLGKVISVLSERSAATKKQRKIFIPYRDSVLTWLLKESLGGNSKTAMIATISPSHHHVEETLSTLRYP
ncbi:Kinesin-like protein kif14 [Nucella lapillus]